MSRDKDHVWASRSYRSGDGARLGAVVTIHLPSEASGRPLIDVEYRLERRPVRSGLEFEAVWALAQDLVVRPRAVLVAASAPLGKTAALPFELPLSLPGLGPGDRVVGVRIERKAEDKLVYTAYVDYGGDTDATLTIFFSRDAANLGDAPLQLAEMASQLRDSIVRGSI